MEGQETGVPVRSALVCCRMGFADMQENSCPDQHGGGVSAGEHSGGCSGSKLGGVYSCCTGSHRYLCIWTEGQGKKMVSPALLFLEKSPKDPCSCSTHSAISK